MTVRKEVCRRIPSLFAIRKHQRQRLSHLSFIRQSGLLRTSVLEVARGRTNDLKGEPTTRNGPSQRKDGEMEG